jgi:tetratricopeptide (TPR) repeat protein
VLVGVGLAGLLLLVLAGWLLRPRQTDSKKETPDIPAAEPASVLLLQRKDVPPELLKQVGFADPRQAPLELVALLTGGSRMPAPVAGIATPVGAQSVAAPAGQRVPVLRVALSTNGRTLAYLGPDEAVHICDLATRRETRPLRFPTRRATSLSFGPQGQILALAMIDGTILLCDAQTGEHITSLVPQPLVPLTCMQLRPLSTHLVVGTRVGIQGWDLRWQRMQPMSTAGMVRCLAFRPDGLMLASSYEGGRIELYPLADTLSRRTLQAPAGINALSFSSDGRLLAGVDAATPASLHVWDVQTDQETIWQAHDQQSQAVAFSPRANLLVSAGTGGSVRLWRPDAAGARLLAIELGPLGAVQDIAFTADGHYLAAITSRGIVAILRMPSPQPLSEEDTDADYYRAQDLILSGKVPEGLEVLHKLTSDPGLDYKDHGELHRQMGELHVRWKQWKEAAAAFAVARKHQPDPFLSWYHSATLELYTGQTKQYQETCQEMLARYDTSPDSRTLQRLVHVCLMALPAGEDLQRAQAIANQGANIDDKWWLLARALSDYRQDRYEDALRKLRQSNPNLAGNSADAEGTLDSMLFAVSSMVEEKMGQHSKAQTALQQAWDALEAWRHDPEMGERIDRWWDCRLQAELLCREAIQVVKALPSRPKGPLSAIRWRNWGYSLRQQNRLKEAEAAFHKAIQMKPDDAPAQLGLGDIQARQGDWKGAAESFACGLRHDPDDSWKWFQLSALYLATDNREAYRKTCQELLKRFGDQPFKQPGDSRAPMIADRCAKPCLLVADAIPDELREKVQRLAGLAITQPNHNLQPWFLLCKGLADYRAGRYPEAIARLQEGQPRPDGVAYDASVFALLAMAHHRRGHAQEAREALQRARAIVAVMMPDPDKGRPFPDWLWHDWIHARFLLHEAEEVLQTKVLPPAAPARTREG